MHCLKVLLEIIADAIEIRISNYQERTIMKKNVFESDRKLSKKIKWILAFCLFIVTAILINYLRLLLPQLFDTTVEKLAYVLASVLVYLLFLFFIWINLIWMLVKQQIFTRFLFLSAKILCIIMILIAFLLPHSSGYRSFESGVLTDTDHALFDLSYLLKGIVFLSLSILFENGWKYQFEVEEETV